MTSPRIGLFATCLVDMFRPEVGFASVKLLEEAGCRVEVPPNQTCCGQPAYNSGDMATARDLAMAVIQAFSGYDAVVVPSGSCAAMIRLHYPVLFAEDPELSRQARDLADRTWELTQYLSDVLNVSKIPARFDGSVTYHDSCSSLRELKIRQQPRDLLNSMEGLTVTEMSAPEECCGFGGTFCVKYPEISEHMVNDKAADIEASHAGTVLAADMGCLMNMAGKLRRRGSKVKARHVAEVLAGMADGPAIGEEREN